jgi:hypothetical protein
MMSVTFATSSGNVNVSAGHGCTPDGLPRLSTVAWSTMSCEASRRDDHCVTLLGW